MRSDIYLLGITCNIHESSAALVKNGLLSPRPRKNVSRARSTTTAFPRRPSPIVCARPASPCGDVSHAGFYWQPWKGLLKRLWWLVRYFPASLQTFQGGKPWRGSVGTFLSHLAVPFKLWRMGFRGRFYFVDHHLSHAASAFFVSPYESAAILTVDLCGEDCTTLFGRGSGQPHHAASGGSTCRIRSASSTRR